MYASIFKGPAMIHRGNNIGFLFIVSALPCDFSWRITRRPLRPNSMILSELRARFLEQWTRWFRLLTKLIRWKGLPRKRFSLCGWCRFWYVPLLLLPMASLGSDRPKLDKVDSILQHSVRQRQTQLDIQSVYKTICCCSLHNRSGKAISDDFPSAKWQSGAQEQMFLYLAVVPD